MGEMWVEDQATFHGRYVDFDRIAVWPKPVQTPHPPVLLGGNGATTEQRVLDHADGWAPYTEPGIADRVRRFRAAARQAGREVSVTLIACPLSATEFEELEEAGIDRCVHWMDSMLPERFENELAPFLTAIKEYE
jgi:alkanesulfonate monooxygenase SsuD/methylene tetrahydromethanopterin reductase-like flavin-dependent oxidoreductase (luciferase family)